MIPISIEAVQKALNIEITGKYDEFTKAAIRNFQIRNSLMVSGEIDFPTGILLFPNEKSLDFSNIKTDSTVNSDEIHIGPPTKPISNPIPGGPPIKVIENNNNNKPEPTTDLSEIKFFIKSEKLPKYMTANGKKLPNYYNGPTKKRYIFIHHTAGWENPYNTIRSWAKDDRGAVATQFVVGGRNPWTLEEKYDGEVVECMNYDNYGWHLGIGGTEMHTHSIGIELCNFGYAVKLNGSYLSWANTKIYPDEIINYGKSGWRGYQFFQKYSDNQLISLSHLLRKISSDQNIDIRSGLQQRLKKMNKFAAFSYDPIIKSGSIPGLFTHTNVSGPNKYGNYEKWDCHPQDELCDMILSL